MVVSKSTTWSVNSTSDRTIDWHMSRNNIGTPVNANLSPFKDLPDPLWIHIFEQFTKSRDRYHLVQTCRKFYLLGLRELYRDITFQHMSHFLNNISFWKDRRDDMVTAPRSVRVHASLMNLDSIGELRRWDLASNGTDERIVFRKLELPPMFMQKLATFPNIREMTFDGVPLPFEFYGFLFFFPHLRELSVINCTLPRRPVLSPFQIIDAGPANQEAYIISPFSFENLPITNLRLTDNRWYINRSTMFSTVGSLAVSGDLDYYNILHLATANNLRTLHINWNTQTANFFSALAKGRVYLLDLPNTTTQGIDIRANLREDEARIRVRSFPAHIETLFLTTRTKSDWLRLPYLTRQRERRVYTSKLDHFLKACRRTMRTLEVEGYLYPLRKPRERVRIRNLEVYEGPLDFLRSVWNTGVNLKKIRIVERGYDRDDQFANGMEASEQRAVSWTKLYRALAEERGRKYDSVKELELKVSSWEDRLMQDVSKMFGQLQVLKIEVVRGFPDEVELENMARYRFPRLPCLSVFHLFNRNSAAAPNPSFKSQTPTALSVFSGSYLRINPCSSSSSLFSIFPWSPSKSNDQISKLITTWNSFLPHSLTEIRLAPATVWRRADAVDTWCQRFIDIDGNLVGNYADSAATGKNSGGDDVTDHELQPSIDYLDNIIPDAVLVNTLDTLDESGQRIDNTRFGLATMVIETIGSPSQNDEGNGAEGGMMSGIFGGTNSIW
ncbi:hypothetical protein C8J55DRAFT_188021 [Lentinula edodes]|uniref:F-box domain-containing protein n=1 Tax=Lentinula lateritia TaxID=40482 RepID=A0A9W8ZY02_9AGAR|nr:hypothetical protein C8J55DRAFT_188021 [Lentinula edodes]